MNSILILIFKLQSVQICGIMNLPMQAVAPSASSAPSSRGDQCWGLSLHSSNKGCFSGCTNCFSMSWHSKSNSSSVLQKKHCKHKQSLFMSIKLGRLMSESHVINWWTDTVYREYVIPNFNLCFIHLMHHFFSL